MHPMDILVLGLEFQDNLLSTVLMEDRKTKRANKVYKIPFCYTWEIKSRKLEPEGEKNSISNTYTEAPILTATLLIKGHQG